MRNEHLVQNKLISQIKLKTVQQISLKNMKCKNKINDKYLSQR